MTCLQWLVANGYELLCGQIEFLMDDWKSRGVKTRRDWWLVLAGTAEGLPKTVDGWEFPVLKAARRRQGFPPDVPGAVQLSRREIAPEIHRQARWGEGFKRVLR